MKKIALIILLIPIPLFAVTDRQVAIDLLDRDSPFYLYFQNIPELAFITESWMEDFERATGFSFFENQDIHSMILSYDEDNNEEMTIYFFLSNNRTTEFESFLGSSPRWTRQNNSWESSYNNSPVHLSITGQGDLFFSSPNPVSTQTRDVQPEPVYTIFADRTQSASDSFLTMATGGVSPNSSSQFIYFSLSRNSAASMIVRMFITGDLANNYLSSAGFPNNRAYLDADAFSAVFGGLPITGDVAFESVDDGLYLIRFSSDIQYILILIGMVVGMTDISA